ncbi:hypothetical protein FQN54_004428 [Arachnomyces sp. PD_36]|nr:hypothetical protein FQN54_004428 [Arachnomyces sp. PD_36]
MPFGESLRDISPKHRALKTFVSDLKETIPFFVKKGYLEPLPSSSGVATEWKTTPGKGVSIFYTIYPDIKQAVDEEFGHAHGAGAKNTTLAEAGLLRDVKLNLSLASPSKEKETGAVRRRVGEEWPEYIKQKILQSEDFNPFKSQKHSSIGYTYVLDHCVGLMAKSRRAPQRSGAVIMRILGLARACGIYELSVGEFAEMMASATVYEQFARYYYAAVLGMDDIGHFGYKLPNNDGKGRKHLRNMKTTSASLNAPGGAVQVGSMQGGKPVLTYPSRIEELQNVKFSVSRRTKAQEEGEAIFMASGLATALSYRPDNQQKRNAAKEFGLELAKGLVPSFLGEKMTSKAQVARIDVHGNPLYQSRDSETVKLVVSRSSDDQKLYADITQIGDFGWYYGPAGVFGTPCKCKTRDAGKEVLREGKFHGIPIQHVALYTAAKQADMLIGHNVLQFLWATDDLPLIIALANRLVIPTYVQGHGECVYCALQNAAGLGCTVIVGGGV